MRLLLINPCNPLVNTGTQKNRWNKYRAWKPLGLMVLAGLTPPEWNITIIDENTGTPLRSAASKIFTASAREPAIGLSMKSGLPDRF